MEGLRLLLDAGVRISTKDWEMMPPNAREEFGHMIPASETEGARKFTDQEGLERAKEKMNLTWRKYWLMRGKWWLN